MTRRIISERIGPDGYHARSQIWPDSYKDWVRFENYEIVDGMIRPVKGARLIRYDPWSDYCNETNGRVPHIELAEVTRLGTDAAILQFVRRYGLFGFGLHTIDRLTFSPVWIPCGEHCIALDVSLLRAGGEWFENSSPTVPDRRAPLEFAWTRVTPQTKDTAREERFPFDGSPRERPLERSLLLYMPAWKEYAVHSIFPPAPKTEAFWRCYQEHLTLWKTLSEQLIFAFTRTVSNLKLKPPPLGYLPAHEGFNRRSKYGDLFFSMALDNLQAFASKAVTNLAYDANGGFTRRPTHPSLIGYMADMQIEDLAQGRDKFFICEKCSKRADRQSNQHSKYCSETCYASAKKARSRARKKRVG